MSGYAASVSFDYLTDKTHLAERSKLLYIHHDQFIRPCLRDKLCTR